jgi:hypothetical protein
MKVLFLDCDGVINHLDSMCYTCEGGGIYKADRRKVQMIQEMIEETGCKVVLCSSWRNMHGGYEYVNYYLQIPLIGQTPGPHADMLRGHDVQEWLDKHPEVENYAILDDETDYLPHQLPHLVVPDPEYGLSETMAYRATHILKHGPRYTIERNDNVRRK